MRASTGPSPLGAEEKRTTSLRLLGSQRSACSRAYRFPSGVTGTWTASHPKEATRNGSAVENVTSVNDSVGSSSSERRRWTIARIPSGIGLLRLSTYVAASELLLRSMTLSVKSSLFSHRLPSGPIPGRERSSTVTMRTRDSSSRGSANVSEIESTASSLSALFDGMVPVGGSMSVAKRAVFPSTVHVKRSSGGHGSAGRNCSVRASSQVNAPGCGGLAVTNRSGRSSGPPLAGPTSRAKNTVTGSHRRRKRSGTTTVPVAPAGRTSGGT